MPGLTDEWSRDDATDARAIRMPARNLADLVKSLNGDDLFMRGNLQDRIGGGVENWVPGAEMFRAEFIQDGCAAAGVVAEELDARLPAQSRAQVRRESAQRPRTARPG